MRWFPYSRLLSETRKGFSYHQSFNLVNVKLKWVKDNNLDEVVARERDLKAVCFLVSIIYSAPNSLLPIYRLSKHRGQLGLAQQLKLSSFMRRYPTVFTESYIVDSGGTRVPCFGLTSEAIDIHHDEVDVFQQCRLDTLDRLCKLLMLTKDRMLPLQTIDQLRWDFGLPFDYGDSLIRYSPDLFSFVRLVDGRVGLKLVVWNDSLAVSQLQKDAALQQTEEAVKSNCLAFPVRFTRGFGLKRKCLAWLDEWQRLPYTSPYTDASHLDPRTDVSEKRIVGVFHELLHLTINKRTERKNVSNLRKPLCLPQKFTKVFERHPGIFYISMKGDTQTVMLREAYDNQQLVHKHPLVDVQLRFADLMRVGFLNRSRGLYKMRTDADQEKKDQLKLKRDHVLSDCGISSEEESCHGLFSEYDSDDPTHDLA